MRVLRSGWNARRVTDPVLATLETYYDAAPRPVATTEEVGPFTLFLRAEAAGWPYYARPRLGLGTEITSDDVRRARELQRQRGVPETFEWVHETTPSLLQAARDTGLTVEECPLLVLRDVSARAPGRRVELVAADDDVLALVVGAISAGFSGSDTVEPAKLTAQPRLIEAGLLSMAAAFDDDGAVVGGGSHSPRGGTTELTGIAVVPRARRRGVGEAITHVLVGDARDRGVETVFLSAQDDAVARIYERVGFVRVGTACMAAP